MHHHGIRISTLAALLIAGSALLACGDSGEGGQGGSGNSTSSSSSGTSTGGSGGTGGTGGTGGAGGSGGAGGAGGTGGSAAVDLDMKEADFECILNWDKVRLFRITNKLGNKDATLAVANNPGGGEYPVGTVIQLVPNEVMVKRKAGFSAASKDWEFFFLDVSDQGTKIVARGTSEVVNGFGGNCLDCHAKAMPQFDFVCEKGHGCDPLPISDDTILMAQNGDARCPPMP